jgi:catechol 2,3-dioxygenase-like lactoylglutathione lyase family enzyme
MFRSNHAFSSFSVDDLGRAEAFYGTTLGLDAVRTEMGLEIRLAGGGAVFVYEKANHEPASFTVLNFDVDDLDAAIDKLRGAGIELEHNDFGDWSTDERGVLADEKMKIAWFKDPAGNVLSIIEEVA